MNLSPREQQELQDIQELNTLMEMPDAKRFIERFLALRLTPAIESLQTAVNGSQSWDTFNRLNGRRVALESVRGDLTDQLTLRRDELLRKQNEQVPDGDKPATGALA